MKKLIFLFAILSWVLTVSAQESTTFDTKLGYNESFVEYPAPGQALKSTDVLKVGDSTWTYTVLKESLKPLKYDVYVRFDSTGGTYNRVAVNVYGKKTLDQPSWGTPLKTVAWTTGKDTTKLITESSTAQQYRYYKIEVKGDNDTFLATIKNFFIKFWE